MCDVGTFVRLCFGVSCGIARARSFVCDRGHVVAVAVSCPSWPWLWRHVSHVVAVASVASWTWPRHGRDRVVFVSLCVVATRRRMLVFAMVLVVSVLSWFAI